jgi:hypothetical protein
MKQKKKLVKKPKSVKIQNKLQNKFSKNLLIGIGILFITLFIIVAASNQRQSLLGNAQTDISPTFGSIGDCNANGDCPTGSIAPSGTGVTLSAAPSTVNPTTTIAPCVSTNSMVSTMAKNRKNRGNNGNGKGNGNGFIQIILQFFQLLLQLLQQLLGGGTVGGPGNPLPSISPLPSGVQPSTSPVPSQSPCPPSGSPQPSSSQQQPTAVPTSGSQPTTPVTSSTCTKPTQVLQMDPSDPQAGVTIGNFYLTNDTWNAANYQVSQSMSICSTSSWFATATMDNSKGDGAVKTYPNEHEDVNKPLSSFSTITSTFAESGPHVGIYEYAYDLWLNGFDNGSTEVMIWNDNFGQTPSGSKKGTFTDNGHTYDVFDDGSGYVAFVAQSNFTSGTVNILNFFNYLIAQGIVKANPTVTQLDYGIELVSTNGQSAVFNVNNFTLTAN